MLLCEGLTAERLLEVEGLARTAHGERLPEPGDRGPARSRLKSPNVESCFPGFLEPQRMAGKVLTVVGGLRDVDPLA